ncbi:hypothetical protein SAMN05444955_101368 [Lihuaxuella thermophila]|uniref:Uncharacterized protein n=1 Tax=Lihuaxuella thermophila TaxID=1173111 RepID=A0A1H8AUU8_9BACL|nr:hypothetical protein SAMN05444955_101368 [Lihuaxuella thermophila]
MKRFESDPPKPSKVLESDPPKPLESDPPKNI